jgi:RIO-like serine/threonine protein kinase
MALDIADLERRGERIGEARNLSKAEVFLVRDGDRPLVVKTLARRPAISRHLLGGFLLRREGRMLAKLAGTPGVPNLVGASAATLVVEWAPGRTLFELRKKGIPPETAERIERVLRGVHERGFAHGDIGRRDVLVDSDGAVSLIDFATAVGPGSPPLLWRILLPLWRHRDRVRIGKMIRRYRRRWDKRVKATAERRAARDAGSGAS